MSEIKYTVTYLPQWLSYQHTVTDGVWLSNIVTNCKWIPKEIYDDIVYKVKNKVTQ